MEHSERTAGLQPTDPQETIGASLVAPIGRLPVQRTLVVLASLGMLLQIAWYHLQPVSTVFDVSDRGEAIAFQIDLDDAEPHELALLPGIGPVLARRIVRDREENGPFRNLSKLERVPGIGPKRLQDIAPWCFEKR